MICIKAPVSFNDRCQRTPVLYPYPVDKKRGGERGASIRPLALASIGNSKYKTKCLFLKKESVRRACHMPQWIPLQDFYPCFADKCYPLLSPPEYLGLNTILTVVVRGYQWPGEVDLG